MKTKLLLFFCLLTASIASAQDTIPNASFEQWKSYGTYTDPVGWTSFNQLALVGFPVSCTKETPGSKGNTYVKLTSDSSSALGAVVPGILLTGTLNFVGGSSSPGYAFTGRPKGLTGNTTSKLGKTDTALISVVLTKWNTKTLVSDTIGMCNTYITGNQSTWKSFDSDFKYTSAATPDTCVIAITSSTSNTPVRGNWLGVDNLAFTNVSGIATQSNDISKLEVYPNPASNGMLYINLDNATQGQYSINMVDINGKTVSENYTNAINGKVQYTINTASLAKGVYMLRVSGQDMMKVQKVTVQ